LKRADIPTAALRTIRVSLVNRE